MQLINYRKSLCNNNFVACQALRCFLPFFAWKVALLTFVYVTFLLLPPVLRSVPLIHGVITFSIRVNGVKFKLFPSFLKVQLSRASIAILYWNGHLAEYGHMLQKKHLTGWQLTTQRGKEKKGIISFKKLNSFQALNAHASLAIRQGVFCTMWPYSAKGPLDDCLVFFVACDRIMQRAL